MHHERLPHSGVAMTPCFMATPNLSGQSWNKDQSNEL